MKGGGWTLEGFFSKQKEPESAGNYARELPPAKFIQCDFYLLIYLLWKVLSVRQLLYYGRESWFAFIGPEYVVSACTCS